MPAPAATSSSSGDSGAAWTLRSRLAWPAARGERLWAQLASPCGLARYDVALCEPSAGHVALVLARKAASGTAPSTPVAAAAAAAAVTAAPPARRASLTAAIIPQAAAAARVVFVVDAVPPRHTGAKTKTSQQQSPTSLSPASTASTRSSAGDAAQQQQQQQQPQQDVDELDLVDELFAATKTGKDGCVLAKSPLLAARFDANVVAIRFTRGSAAAQRSAAGGAAGSNASRSKRAALTSASPLRCVVALEDGMAFVWEWGADLHQWTFLNQFCFLENPNLQWTKPVAVFAATEMAWHGEAVEFAWWSLEAKHEPKLCLRQIQFEQEPNTFRTEITIGNPFALKCTEVVALKSSKLGLWIVTKSLGIHFRSAESLRMVSLGWEALVGGDDTSSSQESKLAARDPEMQLLTCLHNVTGELLILERASGALHLVTPKSQQREGGLTTKLLATLATWTHELGSEVRSVAAHRHMLLITTSDMLHAFNYLTGESLASITLPDDSLPDFQGHVKSERLPQLWTISGAASAAGLWSASGVWFLQTPAAKATASTSNPKAAFEALAKYGEGLKFDSALQALEILEKVCKSLDSYDERVWRTAFQSISSPSLLLALFADQNVPETLVDELARIVASLHQVVRDVAAGGRFAALSLADKGSSTQPNAAQRLTPANVEALHHLSNWVLLAKRKITRLQTSAHTGGQRRMRPRAVSALTTVSSDPSDAQMSSISLLEGGGDDDDHDATNFRLSRKLRPMSSLRFASGSCAVHHGKQWLMQLESFLLDGVAFKEGDTQSRTPLVGSDAASAVPSHLLFHEERRLEDYRSSIASFSRHMYVESMSRLYLLHEPQSLLPFVKCVSEYCPRTFSLSGATRVSRSHAERALSLSPPLEFFTERFGREQLQLKQQMQGVQSTSSQKRKQQVQSELSAALAKDSLLAYTDLLCRCGFYLEACRGLLQCDLFEHCQDVLLTKLLARPSTESKLGYASNAESSGGGEDLQAAQGAVYFELLEFCVKQRGVEQLKQLLELKPKHVSVLLVLRALRNHLPAKAVKKSGADPPSSIGSSSSAFSAVDDTSSGSAQHVTVGQLRPVLLSLMKEQRAAAARVA